MTTSPLLRHAPARSLLARLIQTPDLDRIVRDLPSADFAALVREIGVEDAGELVALASTEQLVAAFDEDLFVNARPGERETFSRRRFVAWLEVLLEAGDQVVARRVAGLSEDFVVHALSSLMLVFDHDQLRERISEDDDLADEADEALGRALNEEIDGYLLVAKQEQGWDAVLALVLALDRNYRALLERILDRCVALASRYVDDLDALVEALSEAETLAEDVEAEREERRAQLGYVEPRAAKGFLALARMPLQGKLGELPRDANTLAYFRGLESQSRHGGQEQRHRPSAKRPTRDASSLDRVLARLPRPDAAESALEREAPELALALRSLADDASPRFDERLAELAYLANVVLAGAAAEDGRRLRPAEAARAALATVAFGAELQAQEGGALERSSSSRATPEQLREVLEAHPADLLFRKACSALASQAGAGSSGLVWSQAQLERALGESVMRALPDGT
ncbi:MAG: hypothetical protein KC593_00350 [Myxococcales bacterium]|nr:hypothetical protein [Myxococcales bacterium]